MYIARHYVRVIGKMFTPSEIITEDISQKEADRMIRLGAIEKMASALPSDAETSGESRQQEDDKPDYSAPVASTLPEPEEADDAEDEEEAEVPEIDVTDGIVSEPEPEEAPAAAPRKRSSKKK